jgi:hypothetical protein
MERMGSSRLLLHNGQQVVLSQLELQDPFATGAAAGLEAALEQFAAEAHQLADAVAVRAPEAPVGLTLCWLVLDMGSSCSSTTMATTSRLPLLQFSTNTGESVVPYFHARVAVAERDHHGEAGRTA